MTLFHHYFLLAILSCVVIHQATSFCPRHSRARTRKRLEGSQRPPLLHLAEEDIHGQSTGGVSKIQKHDSSSSQQHQLFVSLEARQKELQLGIGVRYKVHTTDPQGLTVHYEPTRPNDRAYSNVVARLPNGTIVTSIGPSRGFWIRHDGGGWTYSNLERYSWLERIEE